MYGVLFISIIWGAGPKQGCEAIHTEADGKVIIVVREGRKNVKV